MIMERVPGSPMLDRFKNPLAITGLLRRMAELQTRLHKLSIEGCPLPYEGPLVDRRLAEVGDLAERFGITELGEPLRWLEANREIVAAEEPVFLHNDFHPLNLMLSDDGEICVLDWPDALTAIRGFLIRRYVAVYEQELTLERPRLRYWEALHAAMAWAQVAALRRGHGEEMGAKAEAVGQVPPGFERSLRAFFWKRARWGRRDLT